MRKVATFTTAAEGLANRVLTLEREIHDLDDALLQASAAAEDAKAAVVRNAKELEQQLDDRERLLSVLDRAKMQEALNQAHEQLSLLPGADVPTYADVERKILGRQAVAEAKGALNAASSMPASIPPCSRSRPRSAARRRRRSWPRCGRSWGWRVPTRAPAPRPG